MWGWRGGTQKMARVSHLLVEDEAKCELLKEKIVADGADFATMATAHSTCPSAVRPFPFPTHNQSNPFTYPSYACSAHSNARTPSVLTV